MKKIFLFFFLLTSCYPHRPQPVSERISIKEPLCRVNVIDCNGLSETITHPDRLKEFNIKNFFENQPFKKILRIFAKDARGTTASLLSSYYDNGQIQQYLECQNGRAHGLYQEWFPSGQKKAQTRVIAGIADLSDKAFTSWSFDGPSRAWNEEGVLVAEFPYSSGLLQGESKTYFSSGEIETISQYKKGALEGKDLSFYKNGALLEEFSYEQGLREGAAAGFSPEGTLSWTEIYKQDKLLQGTYYGNEGDVLSSVSDGNGFRSLFDQGRLVSQQQIKHGFPEGKISLFDNEGRLESYYEIKNGKKEGIEIRLFAGSSSPRLSLEWKEDLLHGSVRTWYANGQIESQREFCQNVKQGPAMSWYPDGHIMFVEEYENDRLVRGQYYKKEDPSAVSQVERGCGLVTLFDSSGALLEKIKYTDGSPQID